MTTTKEMSKDEILNMLENIKEFDVKVQIPCPNCGVALDAHPCDECLSKWVTEKVFGIDREKVLNESPLNFHNSIEAAWMIVDHIAKQGWSIELCDMRNNPNVDSGPNGWWFELDRWDDKEAIIEGHQIATHFWQLDGGANDIYHAICKAGLYTAYSTLIIEKENAEMEEIGKNLKEEDWK